MTRVVERQFPFACFYAYIYVSYHTLIEPRTEKHISEVAFLQQYFSRVVSNITNYVGCMDVFTRPVHHYIYMYLQYIYTISCTTVTPNNCYSKQSRRNGLTLYPGVYFDLPCTQDIFHGYQIVQWEPLNAKKKVPQNKTHPDYVKMHGFHGKP